MLPSGSDLPFVFILLIETIRTISLSSSFYYKIDSSDTLGVNGNLKFVSLWGSIRKVTGKVGSGAMCPKFLRMNWCLLNGQGRVEWTGHSR